MQPLPSPPPPPPLLFLPTCPTAYLLAPWPLASASATLAAARHHASMRVARKQATRARATAAALVVLFAAAAVASLLLRRGRRLGGWAPRLTGWATGPAAAAEPPGSCASWAAVDRLADRCMTELPESEAAYKCCAGAGYPCQPCSEGLLDALRCISPRRMLLRPAPGCAAAYDNAAPAQRRSGRGGACQLSSDAVAAGRWLSANGTPLGDAPGMPGAFFVPEADSGCSWRPLVGPAVPRCLRAARINRIVISGACAPLAWCLSRLFRLWSA